jgi:hypothetical protein
MRTRERRLASAATVVTEEQQDMPPSATQGLPGRRAGTPRPSAHPQSASTSHAGLAGALRDAARETERSWHQALSHEDRDLAVLALTATLGDLRVFCARLSACCRLHAMNEPSPRAFARAALVHGAAPFLYQASRVLSDTGSGVVGHARQGLPAAPIQQAARDSVAQWQPAATVDQQALELLADAMDALASAVGALVVGATQPLVAVHACIRAAAGQLRAACEVALPAGSGRPATS